MNRSTLVLSAALASALLAPLAGHAQENSIMQSFHPEKYPAPKTEAGKQTEPDRASSAESKPAAEQAEPAHDGK